MTGYNYKVDFSSIEKWLPQTTHKILYYLKNLASSNGQKDFDLAKTRWELCAKPKNSKAASQVEKIVTQSEPGIDEFEKLLELSHIVEIYVKAFFDKITYRSNSITYLSYKNQRDYLSRSLSKRIISGPVPMKSVKMEFKNHDVAYKSSGTDKTILEARLFRFDDVPDKLYIMGYHSEDEKEIKSRTLYEVDAGIVKIKYYIDTKTADVIDSIKDLNSHDVLGKRIHIVLEKLEGLEMK